LPELKVPLSIRSWEPTIFNALVNVHPPPTPLKTNDWFAAEPFVSIVFPVVVALNVMVPPVQETVAPAQDNEPLTARDGDVELPNVTVPVETVKSRHVSALLQATPYVPAWSKNTESAAVGTDAPLAPPDDADQFAVDTVFHVPVPPTQ